MDIGAVVYKYVSSGGQELRGEPADVLKATQDVEAVTNQMLNVLHDACEHIEEYSIEPKLWEPLWAILYLGQTGCVAAHKEILRFISLDHDNVDYVLGRYRCGLERLPFLLVNTAGGDFSGCFSLLDNTTVPEYIRAYVGQALVMAMTQRQLKKGLLVRLTREKLQHSVATQDAELGATYLSLAKELRASELYDYVKAAQQIPGIDEIDCSLKYVHDELDDDEDYVNFCGGEYSHDAFIKEGFLEALDGSIGVVYDYTFEDMVRLDAKCHAAEAEAYGIEFSEEEFVRSSLSSSDKSRREKTLPISIKQPSAEQNREEKLRLRFQIA